MPGGNVTALNAAGSVIRVVIAEDQARVLGALSALIGLEDDIRGR